MNSGADCAKLPVLDPMHSGFDPTNALAATLAQAGGGGSFGGGGGGGGGDGDGGLLIEVLFWLLRLAIEVPVVGVPLIVIVIVVALIGARRGWWKHQERVIHRAAPAREARRASGAVATLQASDPNFDAARFVARAELAFRKAQSAWCAQELEPLRAFVSDGVFERFSLQVAEQRSDGWRQGIAGLRVHPPTIHHLATGRRFETLTVRFSFDADIHRLALASGKRIAGSQLPRSEFCELWSFVRRRGARTRDAEGLIEGRCPNCGATLAMNQSAICASCRAHVRSGEFDWVLAEITQASEWSAADENGVPGLDEMSARDAGLSTQLLEDRTSVAFWRWSAAERSGRVDPLLRIAGEALCERERERLASRKPPKFLAERAVGSVRTLGLVRGSPHDRALVEVTWDGVLATLGENGKVELEGERRLRRTMFVLERASEATTREGDTFSTARCRSCGAPDLGGVEPLCPYCSAPRTGDASAWLVAQIVASSSPEAATLRESLRSSPRKIPLAPSPSGLLAWAVAAARADGVLEARERRAVEKLAEHLGVGSQGATMMLASAPDDLSAIAPRDVADAQQWLERLCEIALADATVTHAEQVFLRHAAQRFGLADSVLTQTLNSTRDRLYRESKSPSH